MNGGNPYRHRLFEGRTRTETWMHASPGQRAPAKKIDVTDWVRPSMEPETRWELERYVERVERGDLVWLGFTDALVDVDCERMYEDRYGDLEEPVTVVNGRPPGQRPVVFDPLPKIGSEEWWEGPPMRGCKVCGAAYPQGTYRDHCRTTRHEEQLKNGARAGVTSREAYHGRKVARR